MFAKDLSNIYFRHQDTKTRSLIIINIYCLCLGAFVAILSGFRRQTEHGKCCGSSVLSEICFLAFCQRPKQKFKHCGRSGNEFSNSDCREFHHVKGIAHFFKRTAMVFPEIALSELK